MQTFIDRYIDQGKQQGLLLGEQRGEQRGEQQGEQKVLLRLLTRKFGTLTLARRRQIKETDSDTLLRWSEQVLFAATAEEALR